MDDWFDKYRGTAKVSTVGQYVAKAKEALKAAGLTDTSVDKVLALMKRERQYYGIKLSDRLVKVPNRTTPR
jgi:hypothetical protein